MNCRFPILLVEDNAVSRLLLTKILVNAGYEVVPVEDGRKALELFKEKFFPIVVTDWTMPGMDGLELCKAIRKDTRRGYVFIVMLTARDSKDDIVTGLEAGADDYLAKPVNSAELVARIKAGIRVLELERSLKKANEEIRLLSITDPLTGAFNRCYLTERLSQEIARSIRYRHPLSMALCDIDYFKKVNDTYGHQAGDEVLKSFVRSVKKSLRRDVDWVVRYGGEEFLIILPETDINGAWLTAERLRSTVSKQVAKVNGNEIRITASFGVTGFDSGTPEEKISIETLIFKVDKHLYNSKQNGRNMVEGSCL